MKVRGVVYAFLTLTMVKWTSSAVTRLSLVDWNSYNFHEPSGPGTYAFGYDIDDPATNNVQFRNEERHPNGTVTGSYGYVEPDGNVRVVNYIADHRGYRVFEENPFKLSMLKPIQHPDTPFYNPNNFLLNDRRKYSNQWNPSLNYYQPYRYYIPNRPQNY